MLSASGSLPLQLHRVFVISWHHVSLQNPLAVPFLLKPAQRMQLMQMMANPGGSGANLEAAAGRVLPRGGVLPGGGWIDRKGRGGGDPDQAAAAGIRPAVASGIL
jgi:hypothetical protein